jgi:hypothetical protein
VNSADVHSTEPLDESISSLVGACCPFLTSDALPD